MGGGGAPGEAREWRPTLPHTILPRVYAPSVKFGLPSWVSWEHVSPIFRKHSGAPCTYWVACLGSACTASLSLITCEAEQGVVQSGEYRNRSRSAHDSGLTGLTGRTLMNSFKIQLRNF